MHISVEKGSTEYLALCHEKKMFSVMKVTFSFGINYAITTLSFLTITGKYLLFHCLLPTGGESKFLLNISDSYFLISPL